MTGKAVGVAIGLVLVGILGSVACGSSSSSTGVLSDGGDGGGSGGASGSGGSSASGGTGGGGPCNDSADCTSPTPVCNPVGGACVQCLFATDCGTGETCESNVCVKPTTCQNSLDCHNDTVCDPASKVCVECVTSPDCSGTADCIANHCHPYTACTSSLDCTVPQVCDTTGGRCVDCNNTADCSNGQTCVSHECTTLTPCQSDNQCTPLGKLCDKNLGYCVECMNDADCASVEHCAAGTCTLNACSPNAQECAGNAIATCNTAGTGYGSAVACGSQTTCVSSGGSAQCSPWVCPPGPPYCQGDSIVTCASDGLSVASTVDCGTQGKHCVNANCTTALCSPNENYCDGNQVKLCNATGTAGSLVQTCGSGQYCDGATGSCQSQICTPSQPVCNGNAPATCNALGTGYTGTGADCALSGKSCVSGVCQACAGAGSVQQIRMVELFVGTDDYVVLENTGACPVDINPITFSVRSSNGATDNLDLDLPSRVLQPGEKVFIVDAAGAQTGDISSATNIYFTNTTGSYAAICNGSCTAATVIDFVSQVGAGVQPPAPPPPISFTPLSALTTEATQSYQRVAFNGSRPAFLASDWTVGSATRPETAATCPTTQPANSSICPTGLLGQSCPYGAISCLCFLNWMCS